MTAQLSLFEPRKHALELIDRMIAPPPEEGARVKRSENPRSGAYDD